MTSKILCVGALTMDTIFRLDTLPEQAGKYLPREAVEIAAGMASSAAAAMPGLAVRWRSGVLRGLIQWAIAP